MLKFFTHKKYLFLALLEDVVVIFFIFSLITSSLEILLPNILAQKIPLALIFTVFAVLIFTYLRTIQKENIPLPSFSVPRFLQGILLLALVLVGIFMTRAFGVWGALAQIMLLVITLWYWLQRSH